MFSAAIDVSLPSITSFIHIGWQNVCAPHSELLCGLPQSWTLGVDMTFYLLLPFYSALTALLARGRDARSWVRTELLLLAFLGAASLILGGPPLYLRSHDWFRFTALGHMYWFALGLGLAVVSVLDWRNGLPRLIRAAASRPELCWVAAAAIYLITVLVYYPAPFIIAPFLVNLEYTTLNVLQGVAAVLLFIPAVFGNPNRGLPARLLGHPILMWIGLTHTGSCSGTRRSPFSSATGARVRATGPC